jgi:uncharacterized protein
MHPRAAELRQVLDLQPHPEGGWYREVYRSSSLVQPKDDRGQRSAITAIYFLLNRGEKSAWHVVQSDECWHFCEGAPLELMLFDPPSRIRKPLFLGPLAGEVRPFHVVPAGIWQAARSQGDFTLVQCTVGPGFDFEDFRLLRDEAGGRESLTGLGDWSNLL